MALQGTLKDFGIADIFQLIGVQQKTGVLKLKDKEKSINVSFIKGRIVGAESTVREKKEHLGEMLVRADILTKSDLTKALTKQRETLQKLGDILLKMKLIESEDLGEIINLQITETVYRLFKWKNGDYEFVQQKVDYERQHVVPISAESILMDGFRMLDEWPKVKRVIKTYDMVFKKTFGAEGKVLFTDEEEEEEEDAVDAAFAMMDGGSEKKKKPEKAGGIRLARNERRLFSFVDGKRTVQHMINVSRLGEFETCKALANLKDSDLIEVLSEKKGASMDTRNYELIEKVVNIGFLCLFVAIFYFISTVMDSRDLTKISKKYFFEVKDYNVLTELESMHNIDKIKNNLYIYYLRNSKYPETLDALVDDNLLTIDGITDPSGEKYSYELYENSYVVKRKDN